jgi:hypothetical protein
MALQYDARQCASVDAMTGFDWNSVIGDPVPVDPHHRDPERAERRA